MKYSKTNLKNKKVISFFSNKAKLTMVSCCIAFMSFTSCGGNDDESALVDCGSGLWTLSVQTELTAWVTATQTYASDPTPANCQGQKNAGQAYIESLDKIKKCVPSGSLANFNKALEEAKTEINALSC